MSQTIEQRLQAVKEHVDEARTKRIQLQTKLEAAQARKAELITKCKKLGVKPEELDIRIHELEAKIEQELQKVEAKMPINKVAEPEIDIPNAVPLHSTHDDMPF